MASPLTFRYFMVKWIFIEGEKVKNFEVDKIWAFGGNSEDLRLNDNVDSYIREEDTDFLGSLVVEKKLKMWVKVISDQIEKQGKMYQSCFLCIEAKTDAEIHFLRELLKGQDKYVWDERKLFPWPRGIYYGDEVKTYCDK